MTHAPLTEADVEAAALVGFEQLAESIDPNTARQLTEQYLDERGIKAEPEVAKRHLLPHEGGSVSRRVRELEELISAEQQRKERLGPDCYERLHGRRIAGTAAVDSR